MKSQILSNLHKKHKLFTIITDERETFHNITTDNKIETTKTRITETKATKILQTIENNKKYFRINPAILAWHSGRGFDLPSYWPDTKDII